MNIVLPHWLPHLNSTIVRFLIHAGRRLTIGFAACLAPAWTARRLAARFVTPPHVAHTPLEQRAIRSGLAYRIATPMGTLAAWQFGKADRPAIVFSHGWGGRGAQFREFVLTLLDAGYQVWLFDHVGHGLSDGHEAPITDFAAGLSAVVRHVQAGGIEVVGLVGHSLGCAAIGLALRGTLRSLRDVSVVQIAPPASLIRYSRHFARRLGVPERIRAAMQRRLEQRTGIAWQQLEMPQAVASLQVRALIVHDEHDRDVGIESGLAVARAWPDARFKRTSGLGHRRILRAPAVIAAVCDFIADRVIFARAPAVDAWTPMFPSVAGVTPLY